MYHFSSPRFLLVFFVFSFFRAFVILFPFPLSQSDYRSPAQSPDQVSHFQNAQRGQALRHVQAALHDDRSLTGDKESRKHESTKGGNKGNNATLRRNDQARWLWMSLVAFSCFRDPIHLCLARHLKHDPFHNQCRRVEVDQ